jgi:hypothetical protein
MLRAMDVRSGATESSKSKIKASADVLVDLDSFFSLSPGTKSRDLSMFMGVSDGILSDIVAQLPTSLGLHKCCKINVFSTQEFLKMRSSESGEK